METVKEVEGEGSSPSKESEARAVCPYCHEEFTPARKNSTICAKEECRTAKRVEYNRRYIEKKAGSQGAEVDPANAPF